MGGYPAVPVEIRSHLRPGDIGDIVRMHGEVYAREYGLDATFEGSVAETLGMLVRRGWPNDGEGIWVAEADGERVGAVILSDEGNGLSRLRMFVLRPEYRGAGVGRRLLEQLLSTTRAAGYERIELDTFSELRAAAHLYRRAGFRRVSGRRRLMWGREIEFERYELELRGALPSGG
jgi:ribosomal protein S18 acetylase RimI-like enzyme